jgi:hypothetical protein
MKAMHFEVVGLVTEIETIARGPGIRTLARLRKRYGGRGWRKLKGIATVRYCGDLIRRAEVHWYEAHGIGRRGWKIKRFLD